MPGFRLMPPGARGHLRLLLALLIDALGSGLFLPVSLLFFAATTPLSLPRVGLALSLSALVRVPATIAAGGFTDRVGARGAVVISQTLQAIGFASYLFVGSFWYLVVSAAVVQLGNSVFWVAYQALVSEVADTDSREQWFALCAATRTSGLAVGGVLAGVAVGVGGHTGYIALVAGNAVSFAVAAALSWGRRSRPTDPFDAPSGTTARSGWRAVMADSPFLGFVGVNFGFTILSLAFTLALPVFLVRTVGLPPWTAGVTLALNAVLGTAGAPFAVHWISGHGRHQVLTVSQAMMATGFALLLITAATPAAAGLIAAFAAVVLVTGCEVLQWTVVPAVVTDAAEPGTRGRYLSVYQLTFAIGDIIVPALITMALARGAAALWLPLIAIAGLDMLGIAALARHFGPLRRRVGTRPLEVAGTRYVEADAL